MSKDILCGAYRLAAEWHAGQTDKAGNPYIWHLLRVAAAVRHLGPEYEAAGVLHDVLEDTECPRYEIALHCNSVVESAVISLTKQDGERSYFDRYLPRVKTSEIALAVKLADIIDNYGRLHRLPESDAKRLGEKYRRAYRFLCGREVDDE